MNASNEVIILTKGLATLTNRLDVLLDKVNQQAFVITELKEENKQLKFRNKKLTERLKRYENPKNSNNSSIPPSQDENRPTRKSLRERTGKKPGGQKGREGKTLKQMEHPDVTLGCISNYCSCCGEDLSDVVPISMGKRQVIDIPKVRVQVTEYEQFNKICHCGKSNLGTYPMEANAPVSYGPNIESLIGYFSTRHYLPFERLKEILSDVFGAQISTGGIHSLLSKLSQKGQPAYQAIKERISGSSLAVGSDETGMKVNGNKHWAWTWQNKEATFISITDNRGFKSIEDNCKEGFKNAVLVHDCWASHFKTEALSHQICIVHLLRDLNYLTEKYNHKWSQVCKSLLQSAIALKHKMNTTDYLNHCPERLRLEKRLDLLLKYSLSKDDKEMVTFQNRLIKYRDYIFTFLYREEVPADNNASERAVRNIKVKQKISGQFKSDKGAETFAILRSVIDTTIKNNGNVLQTLANMSNV